MQKQLTYNKEEKLKSRKVVEHIFKKGKSFSAFPLKVLYDYTDDTSSPLKAGVTVSSRSFKKAVQRNRVKRVLREAYRLQKQPLQTLLMQRQLNLGLFFIYVGKELPIYAEVCNKMEILLNKLSDTIKQKGDKIETVI